MPRWTRWTVFVLLLAVFTAAVYLPSLRRHANQLRKSERTQGEALREIEQPKIATPTDVKVKAKLFWASAPLVAAAANAPELPAQPPQATAPAGKTSGAGPASKLTPVASPGKLSSPASRP